MVINSEEGTISINVRYYVGNISRLKYRIKQIVSGEVK